MLGDTVIADQRIYEVVWDGSRGSPSLLCAFPRPSALLGMSRDKGKGPVGRERDYERGRAEYRQLADEA